MTKWQPIETAPIENFDAERWYMPATPWVLVSEGQSVFMAQYGYTEKGKGRWRNHFGVCKPTHWMPIPEPPND
jgi:hypothetical protein